jgi:ubiquinone/menaquinone biosynthesis C-methylase UbiE
MFTKSAQYYDLIYSGKDYQGEVARLVEIIRRHLCSQGNRLLDVACGTGLHIQYLKEYFQVEGLDISSVLLEIARQKHPEIIFHHADMIDFDLGVEFDILTCLFSSIGYVKTLDNLHAAISSMARHLCPGGILIIEPWFTPKSWHPNTVHAILIDHPELKIARVNTSFMQGRLSYFDLHHLIGTPQKTEHFVERHELGLFEIEEMQNAFTKANLEVNYDEAGLTGRGLYIGLKPTVNRS